MSFAELNARANQLAHRLIELGAAPERPVGILMRRSLDLFTGLVAILKAGSAYVPMDTDYPPDRLAIMAGDSKVMHFTAIAGQVYSLKSTTAKAYNVNLSCDRTTCPHLAKRWNLKASVGHLSGRSAILKHRLLH